MEVWDYDEFDEDRISITLNNSEFIGEQSRDRLVQRKRKKETYKFNLVKENLPSENAAETSEDNRKDAQHKPGKARTGSA